MGRGENLLFSFHQYHIYGDVKEGVLANLSFIEGEQTQERGLIDGCLEFFQGKRQQQIQTTQLREIESFLREENHLPAFATDGDQTSTFLSSFNIIKEQCLRTLRVAASPIICSCFKVSYKTIEDELIAHPNLKALVNKLKVSSRCGACLRIDKGKKRFAYLEDIYRGVLAKIAQGHYQSKQYRQLDQAGFSSLGNEKDLAPLHLPERGRFGELSLLQKIRTVTLVLDKRIRPFLHRDGGDIVLLDIDRWNIFISYQGSCGSCASASSGTLEFIKETLIKEFQGPQINVIVVP